MEDIHMRSRRIRDIPYTQSNIQTEQRCHPSSSFIYCGDLPDLRAPLPVNQLSFSIIELLVQALSKVASGLMLGSPAAPVTNIVSCNGPKQLWLALPSKAYFQTFAHFRMLVAAYRPELLYNLIGYLSTGKLFRV